MQLRDVEQRAAQAQFAATGQLNELRRQLSVLEQQSVDGTMQLEDERNRLQNENNFLRQQVA